MNDLINNAVKRLQKLHTLRVEYIEARILLDDAVHARSLIGDVITDENYNHRYDVDQKVELAFFRAAVEFADWAQSNNVASLFKAYLAPDNHEEEISVDHVSITTEARSRMLSDMTGNDFTHHLIEVTKQHAQRKLQLRIEEIKDILDSERYRIASAIQDIGAAINGRRWLSEPGRGSYEYDDEGYQEEFGAALDAIDDALEPIRKIAGDWSDCPTDTIRVDQNRLWMDRIIGAETR